MVLLLSRVRAAVNDYFHLRIGAWQGSVLLILSEQTVCSDPGELCAFPGKGMLCICKFLGMLKKTIVIVGGAWAFLAGEGMPVFAQSTPDTLRHLDEVPVVVQARSREVIPVQRLDGQQLERLSAHSVADALRYFSGVQIKDYGGVGGLKTVNIRSMGTQHVGVFYDGVELGNAQNGQVDLGRFSLDNMETISLYNGQKSDVFQSAKDFASAGAVYMLSRTPVFGETEHTHLKATFKTGSFGLANPALLWERKLSDRLSTSLSAEGMYTTGKYRFTYQVKDGYDTTAVRHNGDVRALRVENGWFGKAQGGYWRAKAYLYASERGYPGAVVRNKFMHEDRQWDWNTFVQGMYRKDVSERYHLMVKGKYAYDYLRYLADPNKDETLFYADNRYRQQESYLSLVQGLHLLPGWDLGVAADYQFNALNANLRDFVYPRRHTALLSVATSWRIQRLKAQASLLGTWVHDAVRTGAERAIDRLEWTPTVVCSWQPWPAHDWHLRGFYKRIFRMPTLNDLYYTLIGNTRLNPEYTDQYNVGMTYGRSFAHGFLRRIEGQADAYYNRVEDKIVAIPTANAFRWTMLNLGEVRIKGVDVAVQAVGQIRKDFTVQIRLNYTWQQAQDVTDRASEFYGGQIPYIPWHSGSAALNLGWRRWELNYSFIYTGERYTSQANIPENYLLPWYTSDLALAHQLPLKKGDLRLVLEVNNLFNQQYEVVLCYPMPGINFKCTAQYSF